MTPRRLILVLVAVAAVAAVIVLVATCGEDDGDGEAGSGDGSAQESSEEASSDASPFERDTCELLTPADLREVLGRAVEGSSTPGEEESSTPGRCEWATGRSVEGAELQASGITLFLGDEQIFENTRTLAEGSEDFEELEGIGDEAFVGGGEGGVRIDGAAITVTPIGVNTNDPATNDLVADLLNRVAANY